jgi:uncharacterized protein YecT (DUF1311 family)
VSNSQDRGKIVYWTVNSQLGNVYEDHLAPRSLPLIHACGSGNAAGSIKQPTNMSQMRSCADSEYKKSDARLNRVYERAMRYMSDDLRDAKQKDDRNQAKYEDAGIAGLKEAEHAWLTYRDLQCKMAAQRYEGGTMAPLAYSNCLQTLIEHRIDDLKSVYEEDDSKLE